MLRVIACNMRHNVFGSKETQFQSIGTSLRICKFELAQKVLFLLMKPTGQIDFAFKTGLVFCLRDEIDGDLRISIEESLILQLAA